MNNNISRPDELMHYGVKGMRWGHRKAQQYQQKARYARESAKEWDDIRKYQVNKLRAKGKLEKANKRDLQYKLKAQQDRADAAAYERKAKQKMRGAEFQKKQADVGSKRSRGAKLATNLLAGPFANRTYNSVIAAGGSKNAARAATAIASFMPVVGHLTVSSLYRRGAERNMLGSQRGRVAKKA